MDKNIYGKNPLDADVESFMAERLNAKNLQYADYLTLTKRVAWHESSQEAKDGSGKTYIYNQFNTYNVTNKFGEITLYAGTPNMSSDGKGWGIGQISTTLFPTNSLGERIVPTSAVWNWKTNVNYMVSKFASAQSDHTRFMGYFKDFI